MNRQGVRGAAVFCLSLLAASAASAQQGTAEIRGKVIDPSMGALPGVTVTVTNQDNGNFREAVSGGDGSWFMAALPPGRYQVAAQLPGFKKFVRRDVLLAVGNQMNVDMQLELGGVEETVTVAGESPIIDVSSKEIGGNISSKELSDIPTIARNFTYYRRAAARHRTDREPGVVGIRHADRQRRRFAQQQLPGRRRVGQRRLSRPEQRRSGARAARRGAGVPGPDRAVRRRVRSDVRRDRQRRDQVRARTSFTAAGSSSSTTRRRGRKDFFQAQNNLAKADTREERVRRLAGRTDQTGQGPFLRRCRAGAAERGTHHPDSRAAGLELHDGHRNARLGHCVPRRSPDQREQQLGRPLDHRVVAAEEPDQQRRGHADRRAAGMGSRRHRIGPRQLGARHEPRQHDSPVADSRGRPLRAQRVPGMQTESERLPALLWQANFDDCVAVNEIGDAHAGTEPDLPDLPGRRPERRHPLDHRFARSSPTRSAGTSPVRRAARTT